MTKQQKQEIIVATAKALSDIGFKSIICIEDRDGACISVDQSVKTATLESVHDSVCDIIGERRKDSGPKSSLESFLDMLSKLKPNEEMVSGRNTGS